MTRPMPGGRRRIDRVLDPGFLDDLGEMPLGELRARRHEAEQEEVDLSYVRRMLHGRIDIVSAELLRRSPEGGGDLVEALAGILADDQRPSAGGGRFIAREPTRVGETRREVEQVISDAVISDVQSRSAEELQAAVETMRAHADEVSAVRRDVQRVADALSAELARRYRDGLASVDDLLAMSAQADRTE